MVDCQNYVCIRLGFFLIIVYRPPSNKSENNNHLSQFILIFSIDRDVIGYFNLPSINWGNVHRFQGHFEPTTQPFVNAFVSFRLSQCVTEPTFFSFLVFRSAIYRIRNVNIHCPFSPLWDCPIVFDYVSDLSFYICQHKNNCFCFSVH